MEPTHRIKVKIGNAEFEAEGAPELIKEQFQSFLAVMALSPEPEGPAPPPVGSSSKTNLPANSSSVDETEINQSLIDRVFRNGDCLSLMAIPKGDKNQADALLVLIYGYTRLYDMVNVTGAALMRSMRQSGIKVNRIDRTIETHSDYVNAAGVRRARRYSLNNRGLKAAEAIIRGLLE